MHISCLTTNYVKQTRGFARDYFPQYIDHLHVVCCQMQFTQCYNINKCYTKLHTEARDRNCNLIGQYSRENGCHGIEKFIRQMLDYYQLKSFCLTTVYYNSQWNEQSCSPAIKKLVFIYMYTHILRTMYVVLMSVISYITVINKIKLSKTKKYYLQNQWSNYEVSLTAWDQCSNPIGVGKKICIFGIFFHLNFALVRACNSFVNNYPLSSV